jgi:hypothetical protein
MKKMVFFCFLMKYFLHLKIHLTYGQLTPNSDSIAGFVLGFCTDHSYLDMVD